MKKLISTALLIFIPAMVNAKTLTIGVDLSGSNPLLSHENFAYMASQYASGEINKLKNGDVVIIKTFGGRGESFNLLAGEFKINRRMKPKKVATTVSGFLMSIPAKKELSQPSTNLVAFLEFGSGFNCAENSQILIITDALESSSLVDGSAFMEGKKGLPKADADLNGCQLTFWGLGAGFSHSSVKFIRNEWRNWSKDAGASFTAVIP